MTEIRDRIKEYLAGQGMIKGHSASGASRIPAQDDFLRLSDARGRDSQDHTRDYNSGTSSSGGSPERGDSIESDQHYHQLLPYQQHSSALRVYANPYAQPLGASNHGSALIDTEDFTVVMRCDSPNVHPYEYPEQTYLLDSNPADESEINYYLYNPIS